ncbi:DUF502 domain-containing protein [Riemerella anatipestifer]|uniref:DUF502 domain-containing protein n=1 Tax=Riemerella anatipestifer (strain ATCC 11845 / DSM 15868 / JCM 9532 / NCTC 11014) TaxID=693978 RepID=E4TCG8_RIEAD|nr:DUF502 domain-containing protein [Riemerella anatipestifer]ADQ82477.1 protein of unknown function DUF502 [Riemerella anatipestifer ATCC 11845 = DSM 15868]ADZ12028.1 Protein of unknown function DUF502 [Riemerella anatipestifer RA-GD]AFD56483.1 hypothetical protein RA0C_1596 [Riemerella anatipestifer ATCC 11845 = DSM 15868]AGC39587.1 hypothetical protein G148_0282 [Riemerella anatipestifer RA-CH-2]AKP69673.1 hypothetical protein CG08_1471 [Riemerella anatipestifer]
MNKNLNDYLGLFLRSFLQGLVIIGPVAATVWIIWYIVSSIDNIIPSIAEKFPGLIFILVISSTALIGWLGNKFLLGRILVDSIDYLLEHTPGIKFIYTSLKDVMSSFVGDKKKFNIPVLIKTNDSPEVWRVGFLTQKEVSIMGLQEHVSVYLPHSYAVSGWVVLVESKNVKLLENINAADAMKFAVSGGVAGFPNDIVVKKETNLG